MSRVWQDFLEASGPASTDLPGPSGARPVCTSHSQPKVWLAGPKGGGFWPLAPSTMPSGILRLTPAVPVRILDVIRHQACFTGSSVTGPIIAVILVCLRSVSR